MAQRKSLLEEIREQNSGASFNQQVVDTAKKSYTVPDIAPVQQPSTQQQGQQRTSLLQEIIDSDGMDGLNQEYAQKALDFDGGFGAIPGGYIKGEDGNVYMHDYSNNAEILRQRREASNYLDIPSEEEIDELGFWDKLKYRLKNIGSAAATGTGAGYTGALRALYELGQGGRDRENREYLEMYERELERAKLGYQDYLEAAGGDVSDPDVVSQQYIIDDWQRKVDAMRKVIDENVQQEATKATSELTHELEQKSQIATERAKVGTGRIGKIAVDATINMLQMGGDAAAAAITGGNALMPMALRVFGQGASEAEQAGADINRQAAFAVTAAGIEIFTEKLFDGVAGLYGKGSADAITESVVKRLASTDAGRTALRIFLGMNEEGLEEVISSILSPAAQMIYNGQSIGESYRNNFSVSDMLYDYIIGAAAAGMTNVARPVSTYRSNQEANAALRAQEQTQAPAHTQETVLPTTQETGTQYVQQVVSNIEIPEAQQRILIDGMNIGDADPQTYAHGIQEAFRLGEMGLTYEQAVENSTQSDTLTREQFQHAWEIGAQKAGHNVSTDVPEVSRRGINVPDFENIEEFSRTYPTPEKVTEIFDQAADVDVNEFAAGFRAAYDMGQSGVNSTYLTEANVPALTEAQRTAAYQLGQTDAETKAVNRDLKTASKQRSGNLQRVKGTVRGEGVTIADMRTAFNDRQNTAYRLLTKYAETTGVNIVLYNSQADSTTGLYPETQGRFQWKDDSIYIDINSGLNSIKDVNGLGNYTMLRTFAHEFTHFIEKWNAAEYNEFRQFVFSTLEQRGENVHDLIESMQARDTSGNMTYEQASREVVADAMMDILPDSTLVQQLATEHQNVFRRLLQKLREFTARMKQYYREISTKAPREAQALKENNAYMDSIVQMWDRIAKGAVANYQGANGEVLIDQPAKPGNLPKRSAQQKNVRSVVENAQNAAENAQETGNVRKRVGMDFFRTGEYETVDETAPVLKDMVPRKAEPEKRRIGRDYFPANDFTSQAEEGPDLKSMVPKAAQKPAEEAPASVARTPQGEKLFNMLSSVGKVTMNGYEYAITAYAGRNGDTVYNGRITKAAQQDGAYPVENAHNRIFDSNFATREEAVDDLVGIAENNRLLEERNVQTNESTETIDISAGSNSERNGNGAVRVSSEQPEGTVHPDAAGREPSSVPTENGRRAERDGNQPNAKRNGRSRSEGNGESGVQPGRGRDADTGRGTDAVISKEQEETPAQMSEEEQTRQREELHEETVQQVEQKSTESAGGNNYQIGESLDLPSGSKARYKANVDAIRVVKQLEAEGRTATAEEQAALARYVGWGGIPEAFDERKTEWSKEFAELKELLTDEEYKAAKGSTLNAHYTSIPVIRAMYRGLEKLGFKGGRMLEPSSGVGNFVGAMPANMTGGVKSWTMVELDNITGLIAKHLYPQNDVRIEGFENTILPDGYMDVAIGNVPFGNYPVVDRAYPKKITSAIHNYFFAKSLDKVRTGGIVMFITSSYTMNANDKTVRSYISKKADLLGAIRLPNTAFSGNAGTSVVTDILILKKRAAGTEYSGVPFVETEYDYKFGYQNEYFKAHPDMVLGEQSTSRGMHYRDEYTVNPFTDRGSLEEQIDKAFQNITGKMDYPARPTTEKANINAQKAERGTKQGGYVQKDGKIYQNKNGILVEIEADEKTAKRITGMLGIRDISRKLLNAQQQGTDEKSIKDIRRNLNKLYDSFVKEYGYINTPANKNAFKSDPDCFSLFALENWDAEKKTATKADIFTTDTIKPNQTVTHADTVKDGLAVSRNTTGGVDVPLISRLTGKSEADVTQELIESELAFRTKDGGLKPAETYLSGNVRAKLRDAQGLVGIDKDFQHNVDALKAIVPADIPHEQIFVQPGTPWIPESVYSDFAAYILGGNNHRYYGGPDIAIHRSNQTGNFTIDLTNKKLKSNYQNTQEWGTPKRSFLNLLEAMMNSRSVTVTYKDAEGHTIVDRVATDAANEKIEQITKKFQEWLWEDAERAKDLEYLYNETFNNLVTPKYDGSTLTVNGLRAGWGLRPHQADAVQRIVSSGGNTLLAHRVGAGKTLEMAAAAMKLKELGIVQKPMFAVPKSLVAQWGKEFSSYFPAAKLLVAEQSDFTPNNRKTFANRISTGNYDAIIVSYEQFEKIPISDQFALSLYQEQVEEIIQAIKEAKEESGAKSMSVKDMEKKRKQLEAKIQKLSDKAKDTDSIEFEQLGIDSIFVDEAHNFKNLFYTTSMNNVAGLGNKDGSKRAFDLYTKVRYLQQLNGGRGVVFATATPVMNSMSEMYIMQKYLQPDLLDQLGLSTFDAWAKQFGEVVNGVEIKPSGQGYRVKQSFSRFKNMSELQLLFRNFSDVLTQVPGLKIPKMKGGAVKVVECEAGEFQQEYMKQLEERADNIKNVDPSEDNMLKITSDGRKISYTQRMIDPSLPYEEGCKLYKCAENIAEEYKASKDVKGTQIVFCDMATPKGKSNVEKAGAEEDAGMDAESTKLYDDLKRRLVKLGIPAKEIAFIHDADTDAKKSKLFDDVNAGRVRVLIGSTGKMGVGMNAQKRAVAIHHLDAPWRPGDVEQRDGRVFRQGNINEEVSKYVYVTTGSFDARLWDIIDRKSSFIDQIMNGENVGRDVEDTGEVTLSAAEVKALASGSPLILEQVQLETDIKKLQNLYMAHRQSVVEAGRKLQEAKREKAEAERRAANARKDVKNRTEESTDDKFSITVGNKAYKDKKEAGKVLMAHAAAKATEETYTKVGTFAGFDISVVQTKEGVIGLLKADGAYKFNTYPDNTTLMITNMQKVLNGLEASAQAYEEIAKQKEQEIKAQETLMQAPFPRQEELDQKRKRYNEVMEELNPKEEQAIDSGEDIEEESIRRETISDREILSMASDEIEIDSLTPGEQDALRIFRERLNRLQEAQEQRAELGRQYKDQQFTKDGSKQEAARIRAAMSVLDSKIKRLENSLLSLENKDVLKTVLQKARRVVEQEEKKRGDENLKRYRERRNESAATRKYRDRVRMEVETLRKWLVNPSNKDMRAHVPAEIQKTVANFLESINLMSKTALRTSGLDTTKADEKYLKNMKKMRDAIKTNVDSQGLYSGYADLPEDFMENFEALISKTEEHIKANSGQFVVNEMSAAELKQLSQTLKTLKKYITTMNAFHNNAMFQHTYEAGEETVEHLSKFSKSKKSGLAYKFLNFDYERPSAVFERFGKGGQSIEHEFREGQATQAFLANKIIDFAKKTYSGKEVKAWSEQTKTFELSDGETVTVPITHLMSLYCLNKRPQALTHIYGDGIRVANYKNGKNVELDEGHLVTLKDVQKMIQELTPRQMEVADALQKYMSTETAAWGNYVSMARFDVEQFTEENYFPINSDGRYLSTTADESPDNAGLYALLNSSFTKELKENASNRIILYNIFDVFANHTASMTQYRAFALPMLDALKWFNYKNDDTSVRTKLSSAFGAPLDERAGSGAKGYAEQFVVNLLKAYNGTAPQGGVYDGFFMKSLHKFNRAQIAFNARVVIQQPTAIARAGTILSPVKLTKGLSMSTLQMNKLAEEMEAHSGIAAWKALGFYDTNISRGLTELIKQNPAFGDSVTEVGTKGAELADRYTWAAMWYAAKDTVRRSDYKTEEEYFKAVTDLFEDVIYKTQVVDSVLTKSEFLRSKDFMARVLGSFMSEPMTTFTMLASAYNKFCDDTRRGKSVSEAWQKNGPMIMKTVTIYAISQAMNAVVTAILDAWRDDDDYATFMQKYIDAFKNNVVDNLVPLGLVPGISELWEGLKWLGDKTGFWDEHGLNLYGNGLSNGWAQYVEYLSKGTEITIDLWKGNSTNYTKYGAIYNYIRAVAGATGYPIATLWREVQDIWNNTVGHFNPRMKLKTYRVKDEAGIKYALQDGYLTEEQARDLLLEKGIAKDGNEAFFKVQEWSTGEKKYDSLKEAIVAGSTADYLSAMDGLTDHGIKEKDANSTVKSFVRGLFTGEFSSDRDAEIAGNKKVTESEARRMLIDYAGLDADEAREAVDGWKFKQKYGFDYSDRKSAYMDGTITSAQLRSILMTNGGKSAEDANEIIQSYDFEKRYGWAWSERKEQYQKGKVTRYDMLNILQDYGDMTPEKAASQLEVWDWSKNVPGAENITDSAVEKYNTYCAMLNVDKGVFVQAWKGYNDTKADVDAKGESIPYSKTVKVMPQISALPISAAEKTAIALCFWSQSTVNKYKLW